MATVEHVDRPGEPRHATGLGHLLLQQEPQLLHLVDGRELRRLAHLGRELAQPIAPVRHLCADQRVLELGARVAGHLLQDAEQFPQTAETLVVLLLHLADADLVLLERRFQAFAAALLGTLLRLGVRKHFRLLVLAGLELGLATQVFLALDHAALFDVLQQFVQGIDLDDFKIVDATLFLCLDRDGRRDGNDPRHAGLEAGSHRCVHG